MHINSEDLKARFALFPDDELLNRYASGSLTEAASELAKAELQSRGIPVPPVVAIVEEDDELYYGDLLLLMRYLTPVNAHIVSSCLNAGGVPAIACDTNTVQMNLLYFDVFGGASIRIPEVFVSDAIEIMRAYGRGDLQLREDFDEDLN
jgi:hypothetical protein